MRPGTPGCQSLAMLRSLLLLLSVYLLTRLASAVRGPEDCLPAQDEDCPNGPDCSDLYRQACQYWIDLHGEPYFLPHATNCSRFWECEPGDHGGINLCEFECAACAPWPEVTNACPDHALEFDFTLNYPDGPVCNFPALVDCILFNCTLPCQIPDTNGVCHPECCKDADCHGNNFICDPDTHNCVPGCKLDQDCENWNGICPSCQWCNKPDNSDTGKCDPGCLTDDQCKDPTPICQDHQCEPLKCEYPCCIEHGDCHGYDTLCEIPPWNTDPSCEYCNSNGQDEGTCKPGCLDSHDRCPEGYICDGNHICQPDCVYPCCTKSSDCTNSNTICQLPALNPPDPSNSCEYCTAQDDGTAKGECKPGCDPVNDKCPTNHECQGNHECQPNCVPPNCCTKSSDCNNYNTVCQDPATNPPDPSNSCEYCTAQGDGIKGECKPGCDAENDMCTSPAKCAGTHNCNTPGQNIIMKIMVKTKNCEGCSSDMANEGGAVLKLIGSQSCIDTHPPCICDTKGLDHPGLLDYNADNTATFTSGVPEDFPVMDACYNALMKNVKKATLSWSGPEGSRWYPEKVTAEDSGGYQYICTPPQGTVLTNRDAPIEVNCVEP